MPRARPSKNHSTAQSSVELIVIMAAALLILGVLVSLVSDQISKLQLEQSVKLADASVKKLVESVNEVYLQGAGATRQVVLTWPEGVDANRSYILDHSIVVHVAGTSIIGTTKPTVTGSLPISGGLQSIRLKAFDGFVAIGSLSLTVSPSTLFATLSRDQNTSLHLTFTNANAQSATVTFTDDWNYTTMDLNRSSSGTTITSGSNFGMDVNLYAHSDAVGAFSAKITARATYPDHVETLVIPVHAQVYTSNTGDLSVYPTSLSINTFGADTNQVTIQLCNTGVNTLKTISFTPSVGTPGTWMKGITSIPTLDSLSCTDVDVNVTVPDGTALGSSSGSILIQDFSGNNTYTLPLTVNVLGMNSVFVWDWSTASILQNQVSGYRMTNAGTKAIQINSMIVRNWWKCDSQKGNLSTIVANNLQRYSGSLSDGNTANVTDFNIPVLTSWLSNTLTFDQTINDDNESFIVDVNFSDGTNYTTSTFGTGCGADVTAPGRVSDLNAYSGPDPKEVWLRFTYPGDDNVTGTATGAIVKYSYSSITTEGDWNSAYTIGYTMPKHVPGTIGTLGVTGLDVGYNYYFAIKFVDENENAGTLSNSPVSRAWNNFQWSGSDFNFTDAPTTSPLLNNDINQFRLSNFSGVSAGAQLVFRIYDDSDTNKTWILALDLNSAAIGRVRIWYPMSSEVGIPGSPANYDANTNISIASNVNLLSAVTFPTQYRYNGNNVTVGSPNHFYVDRVVNVTDFNVSMDADYQTVGGQQGGVGGK